MHKRGVSHNSTRKQNHLTAHGTDGATTPHTSSIDCTYWCETSSTTWRHTIHWRLDRTGNSKHRQILRTLSSVETKAGAHERTRTTRQLCHSPKGGLSTPAISPLKCGNVIFPATAPNPQHYTTDSFHWWNSRKLFSSEGILWVLWEMPAVPWCLSQP